MKKIIFLKTILFCSFLSLTHCASMGGKFEKEKVAKIRTIAIVGYTYDSPLETSDHLLSKLMGGEDSIGASMMNEKWEKVEPETLTAKNIYEDLTANLKKLGWKVKSADQVQSSPSVKAFYNKSVKMGLLPLEKGMGRYEKTGIPQYIHVASLAGTKEFAKMAKDLGVDAVAICYVKAKGSQSIPLISTIHHRAEVTFQIFDPTSDDLMMLFTSNGKEVEGTTKTKIGKDFLAGVEKGALASVDTFGEELQKRLKE